MRKHAFYFTADTDMGLVMELLSDTPFASCPPKVEFDKTTGRRLPSKVSLHGFVYKYEYCFVVDSQFVFRNALISCFIEEQDINFVSDMFEEEN
jgi:hypothetical protein